MIRVATSLRSWVHTALLAAMIAPAVPAFAQVTIGAAAPLTGPRAQLGKY